MLDAVRTDTLDYHLPADLIATRPAEPRDAARLMVCHRDSGEVAHHRVADLPELGVLRPGDLMIANDSRVLPAELHGSRVATGGRVSGLFLDQQDDGRWLLLLRTRGTPQTGETLRLSSPGGGSACTLTLDARRDGGHWLATCDDLRPAAAVLQDVGTTPLPPYIRKARQDAGGEPAEADDGQRYNTVWAKDAGSVAAPTAGLHFTPELLGRLDTLGIARHHVTLHVGEGTFAPVRSDVLDDHPMHSEWCGAAPDVIAALADASPDARRLLVGTTTVRTLESLPEDWRALRDVGWSSKTRLFIQPERGFAFRFTDVLMTNFHLPRSTLLALVAALPGVGLDRLMNWYRIAIEQRYRFYSFGDAMLIV
jgi:S-adenosylmethionine:tRNA ribosyltransferase-isomerase